MARIAKLIQKMKNRQVVSNMMKSQRFSGITDTY